MVIIYQQMNIKRLIYNYRHKINVVLALHLELKKIANLLKNSYANIVFFNFNKTFLLHSISREKYNIFRFHCFLYIRRKCIIRANIRSANWEQAAYLFPHHLFSLHSTQDVNGGIAAPLIDHRVSVKEREEERGLR